MGAVDCTLSKKAREKRTVDEDDMYTQLIEFYCPSPHLKCHSIYADILFKLNLNYTK